MGHLLNLQRQLSHSARLLRDRRLLVREVVVERLAHALGMLWQLTSLCYGCRLGSSLGLGRFEPQVFNQLALDDALGPLFVRRRARAEHLRVYSLLEFQQRDSAVAIEVESPENSQ